MDDGAQLRSLSKEPPVKSDPVLSRREAGKAERRRRIIEAAHQLIREAGNVGLSMRALATRARVSLATPYNLFGSKRAVVLALLEDVREFHERFGAVETTDPLERIFAAINMSSGFYIADPLFYKTLWSAVFDTSDEVRSVVLNPTANAFWVSLMVAASDAGALIKDIDCTVLASQTQHIFRSTILDWVVGELASEALAPSIRLGYAMILNGVAASEWRGPLQARIVESQACLLQIGSRAEKSDEATDLYRGSRALSRLTESRGIPESALR